MNLTVVCPGIFLGPIGIVQNIFFSCFFGAIVGGGLILMKKLDRNTALAFGPFIILTFILQMYFANYFKLILKGLGLNVV